MKRHDKDCDVSALHGGGRQRFTFLPEKAA